MVIRAVIQGREYRLKNTYSIRQQAGAISLSNLDVMIKSEFVPSVLGSCQIFFDDVPFFFGFIQSVDSPEYNSGYEVKNYKLTVQSGETIFNNIIISESYREVNTHEIIVDIFEKYIAENGFTLGEVSEGRYFKNYDFAFAKLYDILKELGDDIGASFFITGDKKFNFIIKNNFIEIKAPNHIKDIITTESIGDLRTVQILTGASEETSLQTHVEKWKESQTSFVIGYQIVEVHGATINGQPVNVGLIDVDDTDNSKTFLYSTFGNSIRLNNNALVKPHYNDNIHIVYTGYYEIVLEEINQSKMNKIAEISGTSGKIYNLHNDETIKNYIDAESFANNLLNKYNEFEKTINCTCHSLKDTDFNKIWVFSRPDLNIVGKFIIIERTISSFNNKLKIKVKLTNR